MTAKKTYLVVRELKKPYKAEKRFDVTKHSERKRDKLWLGLVHRIDHDRFYVAQEEGYSK